MMRRGIWKNSPTVNEDKNWKEEFLVLASQLAQIYTEPRLLQDVNQPHECELERRFPINLDESLHDLAEEKKVQLLMLQLNVSRMIGMQKTWSPPAENK